MSKFNEFVINIIALNNAMQAIIELWIFFSESSDDETTVVKKEKKADTSNPMRQSVSDNDAYVQFLFTSLIVYGKGNFNKFFKLNFRRIRQRHRRKLALILVVMMKNLASLTKVKGHHCQ